MDDIGGASSQGTYSLVFDGNAYEVIVLALDNLDGNEHTRLKVFSADEDGTINFRCIHVPATDPDSFFEGFVNQHVNFVSDQRIAVFKRDLLLQAISSSRRASS